INNSLLTQTHCLDDALASIREARRLHEQLIESQTLSPGDRSRIARQIDGALIALEAGRNLPVHVRRHLFQLRIDADHRAGLTDSEGVRSVSEVWDHYERLEAAAS